MRNKRRFERRFHWERWNIAWWGEFRSMYLGHCGSYEDGYYCEHTPNEHELMRKRADRAATQFANEVCGRLK